MTGEKKQQMKSNMWLGGKLVAVVASLTTAVSGYSKLLERQANMLFVLSTKLNVLSAKVAYLEGRLDGRFHGAAIRGSRIRVQPLPGVVTEPAEDLGNKELIVDHIDGKVKDRSKRRRPVEVFNDATYRDVPVDLDDLAQFKEQMKKVPRR